MKFVLKFVTKQRVKHFFNLLKKIMKNENLDSKSIVLFQKTPRHGKKLKKNIFASQANENKINSLSMSAKFPNNVFLSNMSIQFYYIFL